MAPKTLPREALRTVWDDLGYFRPGDVPLLFPRFDPARWPMRAGIYTRLSTAEQNPELQLHEIQDYVSQQAGRFVATYQDTISLAKASRPGLNGLMAACQGKEIHLPDGLGARPLRALPGGLPEQHQDAGGLRNPLHSGDPGARHQYPDPAPQVCRSVVPKPVSNRYTGRGCASGETKTQEGKPTCLVSAPPLLSLVPVRTREGHFAQVPRGQPQIHGRALGSAMSQDVTNGLQRYHFSGDRPAYEWRLCPWRW